MLAVRRWRYLPLRAAWNVSHSWSVLADAVRACWSGRCGVWAFSIATPRAVMRPARPARAAGCLRTGAVAGEAADVARRTLEAGVVGAARTAGVRLDTAERRSSSDAAVQGVADRGVPCPRPVDGAPVLVVPRAASAVTPAARVACTASAAAPSPAAPTRSSASSSTVLTDSASLSGGLTTRAAGTAPRRCVGGDGGDDGGAAGSGAVEGGALPTRS